MDKLDETRGYGGCRVWLRDASPSPGPRLSFPKVARCRSRCLPLVVRSTSALQTLGPGLTPGTRRRWRKKNRSDRPQPSPRVSQERQSVVTVASLAGGVLVPSPHSVWKQRRRADDGGWSQPPFTRGHCIANASSGCLSSTPCCTSRCGEQGRRASVLTKARSRFTRTAFFSRAPGLPRLASLMSATITARDGSGTIKGR